MLRFTLLVLLAGGVPQVIQDLAAEIQGKTRDQVRRIVGERFGPAARDLGSGVSIEQWDIESGVLTFHMLRGPTFRPANGREIWLMQTHNRALPNILGDFSMSTPPNENGTQFWLGTVELRDDLTYLFEDGGTNQKVRDDQKQNFFLRHPKGKFEIRYATGYDGETLLETVPDGAVLGHLVFTPDEEGGTESYDVLSWSTGRVLTFQGDRPISFRLSKSWQEFWK
jgi:hypothetical protein